MPYIWRLPLRRLRGHHLDALYAEPLANGRADGNGGLDAKSVLEVHVILHRPLRDACRQGLVVRSVGDDAESPKRRRPRTDMRSWIAMQLQAFLRTAKTERLLPAFWLAANTGMRRSELLGLRWEGVDLASGNLSISRSLVSVSNELHESRGKTHNSWTWVDLDPATVHVLDTDANDSTPSSVVA